jgi:1-acyl-sn-glycerol-3-phosphate acyltransferase
MFRLGLVALFIVPATLWYGARVLWKAYRGAPASAEIFQVAPRRWSRLILRLAGVKIAFENEGVIDPDRPQILVANHVSWFDVLALSGHLPGRWVFVAKKELADVPVFGKAAAACGQIFIDRQDRTAAIQSLEDARRRLDEERPTVIMFPEGTRSPDGRLQPFKKGAFVLAIQTGVEIIPAAISGSRDVMRKGSLRIRPGTITVRFGRPIDVKGLAVSDRDALSERTWQALAAMQAPRRTLNEPA